MSSGNFVTARYTANNGDVHPIRVQPETIALTLGGAPNSSPVAPFDSTISAKVSGGRRQIGLTARCVYLRWTGAVPDGYKEDGIIRVPVFSPTLFDSLGRGTAGTYLGEAVEVVGTSPESKK